MKEADKTIEKLLAALRDAEPSSGMERRILDGVRAHQATFAPSLGQEKARSPWLPRFAVSTLAAATVLAASLYVTILVRHSSPFPAKARPWPTGDHRSANGSTLGSQMLFSTPRPAVVPTPAQRARRPSGSVTSKAPTKSYPPPVAPLTEQERLLLRVARRRDTRDTPMLNPALEAAQSAKAIEQFQQFFEISAKEMGDEIE